MAFAHGSKSSVWFRAALFSPVFNSWSFDGSVGNHDTTTLEDTWKKNQQGTIEATFSAEGFYDTSYDDTLFATIASGTSNAITLCPGGQTIGSVALLIQTYDTAFGLSGSSDDMEAMSVAANADTAVEFGKVLHGFTEDTNTTSGAWMDNTASTSTGWTGHLHVSLVDGGSWVISLQDSTDGSSVASTFGTFAAATGSTSERLLSAASTTTVRRYVRYVATRTGGSAGDGITFGLSFARTKSS